MLISDVICGNYAAKIKDVECTLKHFNIQDSPMKYRRSSVRIFGTIIAGTIFCAGCHLEQSIDKLGSQLMEQMDNEPVALSEVRAEILPPDSIGFSQDMDVPVYPVSAPQPAYPERLRKKSVEGKATVFFIVDSVGALRDPRIIYATDTSFARALMDAVKTWKVSPAQNNGAPVTSYETITIDFLLK